MDHLKVAYSTGWEAEVTSKLAQYGWDAASVTIGDEAGFPLKWAPGTTENLPTKAQFPIRVEDLTQRWAASLWRGMPEQAELLTEVNLETLGAVIGGKQQSPIMFGAQPASLEVMPSAKKKEATDLLVKLFTKAGLYDSSQTPDELVECVVGLKN